MELTARPTSPSARSSSTERVSWAVRACSSWNSRTFSMAITAWSAKVSTSSICLSENGWPPPGDGITPIGSPRVASARRARSDRRSTLARRDVFGVLRDVGDVVTIRPRITRAGQCRAGSDREYPPIRLQGVRGPVVVRDQVISPPSYGTRMPVAPHRLRALGDRVEHRLEVGRRAGDHPQDLAVAVCCSSASVSSRFRASSSVNSRTFSMAMTAWSAKVFASSICLSVNGCTSLRRM